MLKKKILGIGIISILFVGTLSFSISSMIINNKDISTNNSESVNIEVATSKEEIDPIEEVEGYTMSEMQLVHKMTNNVIVSSQIWGYEEINETNINEALDIFKDDEKIVNYLNQWLEKDFSNSVEFHNYIWEMLGGTMGKATDLDFNKINEVVEKMN